MATAKLNGLQRILKGVSLFLKKEKFWKFLVFFDVRVIIIAFFFSRKNWNLHTWTYAHFNHVILIECTYRFGGWVIGLCSVLQQTNRFLLALGIGNEGKTGCLTFHFFSTPTLWEKMNLKMIGCRHATAVSIENYRFWYRKK